MYRHCEERVTRLPSLQERSDKAIQQLIRRHCEKRSDEAIQKNINSYCEVIYPTHKVTPAPGLLRQQVDSQ